MKLWLVVTTEYTPEDREYFMPWYSHYNYFHSKEEAQDYCLGWDSDCSFIVEIEK